MQPRELNGIDMRLRCCDLEQEAGQAAAGWCRVCAVVVLHLSPGGAESEVRWMSDALPPDFAVAGRDEGQPSQVNFDVRFCKLRQAGHTYTASCLFRCCGRRMRE